MATRNAKGQFVKGGRKAAPQKRAPAKASRKSGSGKTRSNKRRSGRRKRGSDSGGSDLKVLAITALALAAIATPNSKWASAGSTTRNLIDRIPGVKTVGPIAALGVACWAVNRFAFKHRYLKAAGIIGWVAVAINLGEKLGSGQKIEWMGDATDPHDNREGFIADVA